MDSEKYLKQIEAIEQMAKEECIQILKNNPNGRYIEFDAYNSDEENDAFCDSKFPTINGDDEIIFICAVGLDENGQLIYKAEIGDYPYNDDEWFEKDEYTDMPYAEVYRFVVDNLQYAKKEPLPKEEE